MKVVGLTGGIGSGKSTVAQMFRSLGVPVYDSDHEAKRLMTDSQRIREQIVELLGDESYLDGNLNRPYIAQVVFNSPDKLKGLNEIVHPVVKEDFQDWMTRQDAPYVIQETALIFENGAEANYDAIVLITAPLKLRLQRVVARDNANVEDVMQRVQNQMQDDKKKERAHYTIENLDLETTRDKVGEIHQELVKNDVDHQF